MCSRNVLGKGANWTTPSKTSTSPKKRHTISCVDRGVEWRVLFHHLSDWSRHFTESATQVFGEAPATAVERFASWHSVVATSYHM